MTIQLPFDLLALIIDFVAADAFSDGKKVHCTTDLRQCALVSQQLAVYCQRHIFSHIEISYAKSFAIWNLQRVLDKNRVVGSYIKTLSLALRPPKFHFQPKIDRILDKCTRVTSLAVYCHHDRRSGLDWNLDIPKSTQIALESIIHSPMCKTLHFDGIRMPFSVFSNPRRRCGVGSLSFTKRQSALQILVDLPNNILDQGPSYSSLRFLSILPSLVPALLSPKFHDGRRLFELSDLETLWVDYRHRPRDVQPDVTAQLLCTTGSLRSLGFKLGCTCCIPRVHVRFLIVLSS